MKEYVSVHDRAKSCNGTSPTLDIQSSDKWFRGAVRIQVQDDYAGSELTTEDFVDGAASGENGVFDSSGKPANGRR